MFIISNKSKFVYIHIPRTGGTSIYHALGPYLGRNDVCLGHQTLQDAYNMMGERIREFRRICTVRDPFDRAISIYHCLKTGYGWKKFADFIEAIDRVPIFHLSNLAWPMSEYVKCDSGVEISHFIDFRNLESEAEAVFGWFQNDSFPHVNRSARESNNSYYLEGSSKIVERAYKDDFALYKRCQLETVK